MNDINIIRTVGNLASITNSIKEKNYNYEYITLNQTIIEADSIISSKLGLPIASKVFYYNRIRVVESIPVTFEKVFIDAKKVKNIIDIDLNNKSLYEEIQDLYGYSITKIKESINISKPNKQIKFLLNLSEDDDIVIEEGNSYLENSDILEYFLIFSIPGFINFRSVTEREQF